MCKRNINQLPFAKVPTGDQGHNPGMCPDWESNQQPLALQDDAQPTEPRQPGPTQSLNDCTLLTPPSSEG